MNRRFRIAVLIRVAVMSERTPSLKDPQNWGRVLVKSICSSYQRAAPVGLGNASTQFGRDLMNQSALFRSAGCWR